MTTQSERRYPEETACCRTDAYEVAGTLLCCACDRPCELVPYVDADYEEIPDEHA